MKGNKLWAMLLAFILLASVFAACANNGEVGGSSNDTGGLESGAETEELDYYEARKAVSDDLPEDDYEEYEYHILTRSEHWLSWEISSEEEDGDVLNDAVYRRNRTVEDRYNVKIVPVSVSQEPQNLLTETARRAILSETYDFDLISGSVDSMSAMATEGLFRNLTNMDYIDFEKPWWVPGATAALTIDDKAFLAAGDFSMTMYDYTFAFFFNKRLVGDYNIESPYTVVNEGRWTIDYLFNTTKEIYADLNQNNTVDAGDLFGYGGDSLSSLVTYMYASGHRTTTLNAEGIPELTIGNEKIISIIDKVYALVKSPGSYVPQTMSGFEGKIKYFTEGQFVFIPVYLMDAKNPIVRDMPDDFGIVPYPKYDDEQEVYYTQAQGSHGIIGVPISLIDESRTAIILSALTAESYKQVVPIYYEVMLKAKLTRDNESVEMLDLLMGGLTFDIGYMHGSDLNWIPVVVQTLITADNTNFSSYYASNQAAAERGLQRVIDAYMDIES